MSDERPRQRLSASLLCADPLALGNDLAALERAGVDYLHVDMADGHFVPLLGIGIEEAKRVRQATSIPFDVHLLVSNPDAWIPRVLEELSPSIVTFPAEATAHGYRLAQTIRRHGAMAGVSVNPGTSLATLDYLLPGVDLVLVMTINPGIVGQTVIPGMIEKIADLRQMIWRRRPRVHISADGNVSFDMGPRMTAAGADFLVCGSGSVFDRSRSGIVEATAEFRNECGRHTPHAVALNGDCMTSPGDGPSERPITAHGVCLLQHQIVGEIGEVLEQVDPAEANRLVDDLLAARRVFIFAVGRVLLSLQCLGKRLNHLGIECQTVGAMDEKPIGPEDLLLIASGSGESRLPADIATIAKTKGARLALITSAVQSAIKSISDTVVHLPCPTKNEPTRGVKSIQLMSTVFDQALHVFGDALALQIQEMKRLDHAQVWQMHANLE